MKKKYFIYVMAIIVTVVLQAANLRSSETIDPKCAMPSFEVEYEHSTSVFVGEVIEVSKEGDKRQFVFEVKRFWKGVTSKKLKLSVTENMRFQAPFEEGKTYLVFAKKNEDDGELFDGRCSRSAEIGGYSSTLEGDVEKLGDAKTCISLGSKEINAEDNE